MKSFIMIMKNNFAQLTCKFETTWFDYYFNFLTLQELRGGLHDRASGPLRK